MTSAQVLAPQALPQSAAPSSRVRTVVRRLPAAAVGLIGAGMLVYGVTQPWVTTFAGLLSQNGWDTRNGNILVAGAIASAVLALAQVVFATTPLRWLLGLVGFATAAYAGYLLIQLYTVTQSSDSMIFLGKGPGLYIAATGAVLVAATIFLPMPATTSVVEDGDVATGDADATTSTWTGPAFLTRALRSPLRFPAALLAVVAGLSHVPVTPEHLNEAPYIGAFFIALTVTCALLAAGLLLADTMAVWASLGGACLLAVIAFVLSRTVGLPLIGDDVGNWLETLGVVSVLTEAGVVILSAAALLRGRLSARA